MMKKTETNLKQIAYETIKRKIIHCDYMPNDILSEMMLMEEIDASRTPIREALNMLSQEGLVRIIPKKGIMVLPLTMKEVAMTFEARMLMEPYIIEHYSQYIDHVKLQEFRKQTEEILQTDIADNEHLELINYIESGDLASAVAAMRVHLIHSKEAAFESLMQ